MVVSVHAEASRAGVDILRSGGNAVDAAVAVGFALAVVHPQAGNLGGGGFLLLRTADGAEHFLDFREQAPAQAQPDMYLDPSGRVIAGASVIGYRSIGVPGSVAGMAYAQRHWGRLSLAQVMAPAIRLARMGFTLSAQDCRDLRDRQLSRFASSRRLFQRNGRYYVAGEIFRQPELARTLERLAADPDEFYHGLMARQIAAGIRRGGGLVTEQDLAAYQPQERRPVHGSYRGYEIISAPPPSSGGVSLVEMLNILQGYDLSRYAARSPQAVHLVAESLRRAFFDRAEFLGDPDFSNVPVAQLIDRRYGAAWREELNPGAASRSADLRRPAIFSRLESYARLHPLEYPGHESQNTTHYSIVDAEGNAVAVTTTLNDTFGSRVTLGELGFLLNDEMDDFTSKPGTPNRYGLVQGPANSIAPRKRPLSSMTPTIVLRPAGRPGVAAAPHDAAPNAALPDPAAPAKPELFLVLGSPGGPRIISTVANILIDVIDHHTDIQAAVNSPRFHHQWMPDMLWVEPSLPAATVAALERMGHRVRHDPAWSDGECILIDPKTGERLGASDWRHNGKALGY